MKKEKIYSVYYVDTQKNDISYIEEFNNIDDLAQEYKLKNKKSVYHYIYDSIDGLDFRGIKNLLDCKYIIVKDLV